MKLLMISTDRKIFEAGSAVRSRMLGYVAEAEKIFIVVVGQGTFASEQINERLQAISLSRTSALFWNPREHFDLVTAQDPFENGFIAWILAKRLKARLELQIHTDLFSPYFTKVYFLNKIRIILAKFLLPRADKIRVVSNRIRDSLVAKLNTPNSKIEVRPIFVDIEKIKNAPIKTDLHKKYPQFDKIILMASRLTKEKHIDLAIELMPKFLTQEPKTGLIIVGSGPEEKRLKAKSTKLKDHIIFEPWSDDLPSYYKTADLFLNTSWYEGYGMTLVEAKAAGCLVVSTDVGVAKEIGANIIPHEDAKAAAQIILKTL